MDINNGLDPYFLLKLDMMIILFSLEVTFLKGLIFFDIRAFSVLSARCEGNSKDEEVLKRQFSFLEGKSRRRSEDEVNKVSIFLIRGKIFSTKGPLQNLLLGIKDE